MKKAYINQDCIDNGEHPELFHLRENLSFLDNPDDDEYTIREMLLEIHEQRAQSQDSYRNYLESEYWQKVKEAVHKRANGKCEGCGWNTCNLQVHHKSYPRRYTELNNLHLLILLCESCHKQAH